VVGKAIKSNEYVKNLFSEILAFVTESKQVISLAKIYREHDSPVQEALIQIQLIQNTTITNTNLLYRLNLYVILFRNSFNFT